MKYMSNLLLAVVILLQVAVLAMVSKDYGLREDHLAELKAQNDYLSKMTGMMSEVSKW